MPRSAPYDRDQALDRALDLFWRQGYHATSLKDLETTLQMKPGSIYAAFKSKEALFCAALDRYRAQDLDAMNATVAAAASPLEGLKACFRGHALGQDGQPRACMLSRTALELAHADTPAGTAARAHLSDVEAAFADHIIAAQRAGEIDPDANPERLAKRVQAKLMGLSVFTQRRPSDEVLRALVDDLCHELSALAPPATADHR